MVDWGDGQMGVSLSLGIHAIAIQIGVALDNCVASRPP
jgi:hypothetical protein